MVILVILFQNEIRQALIRLGSRHQWSSMLRFFGKEELAKNDDTKWVDAVILACQHMSEHKVGALIVVQRYDDVEPLISPPGCEMDAIVSARLIEQVFFKNSPLHDGAMIVRGDRIVAARCTLPITSRTDIPASFGMRHKAAIGITEESDATVVVVSEETGNISYVKEGNLRVIENIYDLKLLLSPTLGKEEPKQ
jgi:uncharacterized protein (TIGR00159 family)